MLRILNRISTVGAEIKLRTIVFRLRHGRFATFKARPCGGDPNLRHRDHGSCVQSNVWGSDLNHNGFDS